MKIVFDQQNIERIKKESKENVKLIWNKDIK